MGIGEKIIDLHHPAFFPGKAFFVHLVRVIINEIIGRLDNLVRRPVILLQPENSGILIFFRKPQEMVDVGAPESVYGLPVIPHAEQVPVAAQKKACQVVLEIVGVLVFIHQDIGKIILIKFPDILMVPQKVPGFQKNIVKIHPVHFLQALFILGKEILHMDGKHRGPGVQVFSRIAGIFGPGNGGQNPGALFFLDIVFNADFRCQFFLLINGKHLQGGYIF